MVRRFNIYVYDSERDEKLMYGVNLSLEDAKGLQQTLEREIKSDKSIVLTDLVTDL